MKYRIEEAELLKDFLINKEVPILKNSDPLRIILHTSKFGLSGIDVDKKFIKKRIIGELAEPGTLTFCLGLSSHKRLGKRFVRTWNEILTSLGQQKSCFFRKPPFSIVSKPHKPCFYSWGSNYEKVKLQDAIGRISVEMVCPYPPGIPLLIPGEILDEDRVNWLIEQKSFWPDQISDFVRVIS